MTPKAGFANSRPGRMPERIFALYQYSMEEIERAEQMFLDAGTRKALAGAAPPDREAFFLQPYRAAEDSWPGMVTGSGV